MSAQRASLQTRKLCKDGPLPEDAVTVLLVGCECLHYFGALADYRPDLAKTRLDQSAMHQALNEQRDTTKKGSIRSK